MKILVLALWVLLATASSSAFAGQCQWKFYVKNTTGERIQVDKVSTRTGGLFKVQWSYSHPSRLGQFVDPGEKSLLAQEDDANPGYSFTTDTACKPDKDIDFRVRFYCDSTDDKKFIKKKLDAKRDGEHTMTISRCSDETV